MDSKELIRFVSEGYEVSNEQAVEYINIFQATESGQQELFAFCKGFGLTEKEVGKLFEDEDEDE